MITLMLNFLLRTGNKVLINVGLTHTHTHTYTHTQHTHTHAHTNNDHGYNHLLLHIPCTYNTTTKETAYLKTKCDLSLYLN